MLNQSENDLGLLDSVATRVRARPIAIKTEKVKIHFGRVADVYCQQLFNNIAMVAQMSGGSLSLTLDELKSYVWTLIVSRVAHVNVQSANRVVHPRDRVTVPAFISLLLRQIGRVEELRHGLTLVPEIGDLPEGSIIKVLKVDEMHSISAKLKYVFSKHGFEYAEGYNTDTGGSIDFMMCIVAENVVTGLDPDLNGAIPYLAAVVELNCLRTIFVPTQEYIDIDEVVSVVATLASPKQLN